MKQCPNCSTENRETARFCKECGWFLAALCPQCRRELPDHAKFCDACGFDLSTEPAHAKNTSPEVPRLATPPRAPGVVSPLSETPPRAESPASPTPARADASPAAPPPPAGEQLAPREENTLADTRLQRYIPKELMTKLNAAIAGGGLVGERRVVTMLFCDIKGSTAAAEQLDPEDWTDVINGAFENMIKPVYKYEGTVARLMGDSILAFFGAPISHEDDAARAVLAGLEIVAGIKPFCQQVEERFGVAVDVRVGINTGMVVVGAVGSDLRMEYTAMGDAINLAARMEQTAEPGTVRIAHDTYKLVAPLFEVEELGGIAIKGKEGPVRAYRVLARKAEPGRLRGLAGLDSRLIGRSHEMASLDQILDNAEHGVGHIVCLVSEAGLGKTRLIDEIRLKWKDRPTLAWYSISSLSYESSNAYSVFQSLVRQLLGMGLADTPADARRKLETLLEWFTPAQRDHANQVLSVLLGIANESGLPPLEGDAFRRELYAVMEQIFRRTFSTRPGVLVIDDLHWSDAASVELLISLLPLTNELPLVLLYALRPNRQAPGWQVPLYTERELSNRYTELKLRPLSAQDSRLMVETLLGGLELADELMDKILERALGNPFFTEEVVRSLIENGTFVRDAATGRWAVTARGDNFDIPDSLHALLAARIDQLEEMTRRTLQLSAVIGRSFYERVLAAIVEPGHDLDRELGTLQRLDMIGEAARLPEIEYRFRNPLTQEVVYKSILVKQRREFHRRVAETMQALYPDRLDEYAVLLAHHFVAADLYGQAIEYLRRAARRALSLYAYDDATRHYRAALDLVPPNASGATLKAELLEELADVRRGVRDFSQAIALYLQALEQYRASSDYETISLVRVHRKLVQIATEAKWSVDAATYTQINQVRQQSLPLLEASLREIEGASAHAESVFLYAALSMDAWRSQDPPDWESARRFAQSAVDMAEQLDDPVVLSQALGALASVMDGLSLLREHLAVALRRFEISSPPQFDARERIDALRGLGAGLMYVGEYAQALPHLVQAETLAARTRTIDQQASAIGLQAQCHLRADHWEEVLQLEDKWRELERTYARERVGETCFFVALSASVYALRGDLARAEQYRLESFEYMLSVSGPSEDWQRNQFY